MDNTYSYQASGVYFQPTGPDGKPVMGDNINQVTYTPPVEYTGGDVVQRIESAAQNVDWKRLASELLNSLENSLWSVLELSSQAGLVNRGKFLPVMMIKEVLS